ncbi:hypothetical protein REPUB_Repub16aG0050100 [Reevesia pubescens]
MGGVLRNNLGERLLVFSKPIGYVDSNMVEFLAMLEAFSIFVESKWVSSYGSTVQPLSSAAAAWFGTLLVSHCRSSFGVYLLALQ